MLVARLATAVGLALLLLVGAWSTSHGSADVHSALCLASGTTAPDGSSPADAFPGGEGADALSAVDVLSSDVGLCMIAVLCGVASALLLRRLRGRTAGVLTGRTRLLIPPTRAGPDRLVPARTLTQLSVSRT